MLTCIHQVLYTSIRYNGNDNSLRDSAFNNAPSKICHALSRKLNLQLCARLSHDRDQGDMLNGGVEGIAEVSLF